MKAWAGSGRLLSSRRSLLIPSGGIAAAACAWVGSGTPSYWGDEAASVMSATRPLGSLFSEMTRIDAVHGVYYLFLHVWVRIFGTSELATRTPSAIAVGLAVAGTMLVALQLTAGVRVVVLAGAVTAMLPRITWAGTEARPYAFACAAAAWVCVAFIAAAKGRGHTRLRWARYAVCLGAAPYLFLYLGLLAPVHAAFLSATAPKRVLLRRWVPAASFAFLLAAPIAAVAISQREQVAFLARRHYLNLGDIFVDQWFGAVPAAVVCWALILCAVVEALQNRSASRSGERELTILATLWLSLPTTLLVLESVLLEPTYNMRYLSFSAPAAGLLVALGAVAVSRWCAAGARRLRWSARLNRRLPAVAIITLVTLLAVVSAPVYVEERGPYAKDEGSDWRQLSDYVAAHARRGDAVVFDETTRPSEDPRLALRLYPAGFRSLRDVELRRPYDERPWLWDDVTSIQATFDRLTPTVWAVELPRGAASPADITALSAEGYDVTGVHRVHRDVVYRLQRETEPPLPSSSHPDGV